MRQLDPDLETAVATATRTPLRSAAIGFVGVLLIVLIDFLAGGRLGPGQYAAIALAIGVVDTVALGGAYSLRRSRRIWARQEQARREQEGGPDARG